MYMRYGDYIFNRHMVSKIIVKKSVMYLRYPYTITIECQRNSSIFYPIVSDCDTYGVKHRCLDTVRTDMEMLRKKCINAKVVNVLE